MTRPVSFLHLTDLHLSTAAAEAAKGKDAPSARLRRVLAGAPALAPAFVAITGDLADRGAPESYEALAALLAGVEIPVLLCLGNHDARGAFRAVFAPGTPPDAPWCEERILAGLHLIGLDTLAPGRIAGALGPEALAFLDAALARHPELPKLIFLHHPPALGRGLGWDSLDSASTAALAARLRAEGPARVAGIFAGHVHLDRVALWEGVPVLTNAGLSNAIDPAERGVLRLVEGASWARAHWDGATLSAAFAQLSPERREIRRVPLSRLRA